jgi:hypothetical protein
MKKNNHFTSPILTSPSHLFIKVLFFFSFSLFYLQSEAQGQKQEEAQLKAPDDINSEITKNIEEKNQKENQWEFCEEKKGVKVFTKKYHDSPVVGLKGEMLMQAPLEKILWLLLDNEHRKEWVDRLKESQTLESISPFEYYVFQEFHLPWPFSNRDFVYHGKVQRLKDNGVVKLNLSSADHPKAPPTKGVRAKLIHSSYTLTPMGQDQTKVELEILSDPMGKIPSWLINLIQRSWPVTTLTNISEEVKKSYVQLAELPSNP